MAIDVTTSKIHTLGISHHVVNRVSLEAVGAIPNDRHVSMTGTTTPQCASAGHLHNAHCTKIPIFWHECSHKQHEKSCKQHYQDRTDSIRTLVWPLLEYVDCKHQVHLISPSYYEGKAM